MSNELRAWNFFQLLFLLCPFVLKTYQRNHVANEIRVALAFFKNLEPKIDKYGKKQNNSYHSVAELMGEKIKQVV